MTTRGTLWLGFGTLTALLALFSVTVIFDLRGIQRDLYEQSEVARPRSAAARQMEIHLLGYALAVRSYLHLGEARFLDEASAEAQAVDERLAFYAQLARTPQHQALAARFAAGWREYRQAAERTVKGDAPPARQIHDLVRMRSALEKMLSDELQVEAQQTYNALKDVTASRVQALVRLAAFLLVLGVAIGLATATVVSRSVLRSSAP